MEVLVVQHVHDVLDVRLQVDIGRREVRSVTQPGQRDRVDVVTCLGQRALQVVNKDPRALQGIVIRLSLRDREAPY